jgi:FkbM family methyltransferase
MTAAATVSRFIPDGAFCTAIAMAHRRFEPEMIPIVSACDPDGVAVDVGAWFGPWTHWLSRRVESVVAFEPNPSVVATIQGWVGDNVEVRQLAVSDEPGTVHLAVSGQQRAEEGRSYIDLTATADNLVEVEATTLDAQALDRVRLLKIDVEGHELAVLRGGVDLIERCHPVLVVELESRYGDVGPVFDLLGSMGYRARVLVDRRWERTGAEELTNVQQRRPPATGGYLSIVVHKGHGYVNNVVFAHPESTWVPW